MVHRRGVVACAFLTLLVALFVAGPAASRRAEARSPVSNSRDSNIRHLEALLAVSPAVIAEHIELSKASPLGQVLGPARFAVLLVSWIMGLLAGWLILQRVTLTRRGRAPPRVAA